jgi:hypothetical protein
MPPAIQQFGWVPFEARTEEMHAANDAALASMPKFEIKGRQSYGDKVALFDWSKTANGGKHLTCFKQIRGSCVGNGLGMALWVLAGVQRVKLGDLISMIMPFWPGALRQIPGDGMGEPGQGRRAPPAPRRPAAHDFGAPPIGRGRSPQGVDRGGREPDCFGKATEVAFSYSTRRDRQASSWTRPSRT